jgi:hypothetical protein
MKNLIRFGSAAALLLAAGAAFAQSDACSSATPVGDGSYAFDTTGATNDYAGTCGASGTSPDVWFLWTCGASGTATVNTCGSGYDTVLEAVVTCGGPTIVCNDDSCGLQSAINLGSVTIGDQFLIRVSGFAGSTGTGTVTFSVSGAPGNDNCANAIPVGEGTHPFSNVGATQDGFASCGVGGSPGYSDVWYLYTPSFTGTADVETCGLTTLDTMLSAYDACGGMEIGCNDDSCSSLQSRMTFPVTSGVPVYIRIASWSTTAQGSGSFLIQQIVAPPNDECATATPVGEGTHPFSNIGATTNGFASCGFGGSPGYSDVWFAYTPSFTGFAEASTCGLTLLDTQLNAFDACGGLEIACNDDACASLQSRIVIPVTAGVTVYIRLASWDPNDQDVGNLLIQPTAPPPANDDCANAMPVGDGSYAFDTSSATNDYAGTCGASGASPDVWFLWTAGSSGCATVSTCGSGFDTVLEILSACGGPTLACNDDACGLQSTVTLNGVNAGDQILVRVSGFAGAAGAGTVTMSVSPSNPYQPPSNCTPEPEPCDGIIIPDGINGGCNDTPPTYGSIQCGETICGTTESNPACCRDTDWFLFTLTQDDTVTFSGQAQANMNCIVVTGSCPTSILGISPNSACSPDFSLTLSLTAGTYALVMVPVGFPTITCGSGMENYWVTMSLASGCGAPCDADVNCDGSIDGFDVEVMEQAVAGDLSNFCQANTDFNGDGSTDGFDVEAVEQVVGGAPCP